MPWRGYIEGSHPDSICAWDDDGRGCESAEDLVARLDEPGTLCISEPGKYRTRGGSIVELHQAASSEWPWTCAQRLEPDEHGVSVRGWRSTGKFDLDGRQSRNDIVAKVEEPITVSVDFGCKDQTALQYIECAPLTFEELGRFEVIWDAASIWRPKPNARHSNIMSLAPELDPRESRLGGDRAR
jgi:hypothetical protein